MCVVSAISQAGDRRLLVCLVSAVRQPGDRRLLVYLVSAVRQPGDGGPRSYRTTPSGARLAGAV